MRSTHRYPLAHCVVSYCGNWTARAVAVTSRHRLRRRSDAESTPSINRVHPWRPRTRCEQFHKSYRNAFAYSHQARCLSLSPNFAASNELTHGSAGDFFKTCGALLGTRWVHAKQREGFRLQRGRTRGEDDLGLGIERARGDVVSQCGQILEQRAQAMDRKPICGVMGEVLVFGFGRARCGSYGIAVSFALSG